MLSGVLASSPLVLQTFPANKLARFVGGKASGLLPGMLIDAPIPVEVSLYMRPFCLSRNTKLGCGTTGPLA